MATNPERSIRILVDRSGFHAHLPLTSTRAEQFTRDNVLAALKQQGIPITDEVTARINQLETMIQDGARFSEPFLLAEGKQPVDGKCATFELDPQLITQPVSDDDDLSQADFHRSQILTVEAGAVIGTLNKEVPPQPGMDVFGKTVPAANLRDSIKLGSNVSLSPDGTSVIADKSGMIHVTRYEVSILPVVEIDGDIDFSTGDIDAPGDVLINGTIRDSFKVKVAGSLTVRGAIEAASVEALKDLHVNGGINGREQVRVVAGGEVFAKFCGEARLEAGGDITVTRECLNCQIRTGGFLMMSRGKIIGGRIYARAGAEIGQLGNDTHIKTEIAVGVDPKVLMEAASANEIIRKKRDAIAKIRQSVQPLMAQIKRLTPAQRERATELLYQADAMEQEIVEHERSKATVVQQKLGPDGRELTLTVNQIAHPGTSIIFGDRITTLHKERKGPFKFVCRVQNRVEEILAIDKITGSVTVLNSREYKPALEAKP